ncbi:MAG: NAD(P)H-dependent glycerol-3-phosphate dehydrogenase [Sphingobacteriia bacterium]
MKHAITVIGYGSWGTALVQALLQQQHRVHWHLRSPALAEHIRCQGRNPRYLTEAHLDTQYLQLYTRPEEAMQAGEAILLVTPSAFLHTTLSGLPAGCWGSKPIASGIKGLVPETHQLVSDYLVGTHGCSPDQLAVISGPAHSEEVSTGRHTWLTVASPSAASQQYWLQALQLPHLHPRPSSDLDGIQWGGILKNVFAIAAGIAKGLGHGDNMIASLVGEALYELEDVLYAQAPLPGRRMGAPHYLGDLLATFYSPYSRNRQLGILIGQGHSPQEALGQMGMVAEGYYACRVLAEHYALPNPIIHMVAQVLYRQVPVQQAFASLLADL